MNINKLNYELYFINYYESNLTKNETDELFLFINQHADLKNEFESYKELHSLNNDLTQNDFSFLKKKVKNTPNIDEFNAENFLIAEIENDLTEKQQSELNQFVFLNSFFEKERSLYKKTKLEDNTIVFRGKNKLKKPTIISICYKVASVAALFIIGLFIFNLSSPKKYTPRTSIANYNFDDPALNVKDDWSSLFALQQKIIPTKTIHLNPKTNISILEKIEPQQNNISEEKNTAVILEKPKNEDLAFSDIKFDTKKTKPKPKIEPLNTKKQDQHPVKKAITKFLKKKVLKENPHDFKSHLQDMELAHTVVRSINKVLGTHISLEPTFNEYGEMVAYAIETEQFEFKKQVKNK